MYFQHCLKHVMKMRPEGVRPGARAGRAPALVQANARPHKAAAAEGEKSETEPSLSVVFCIFWRFKTMKEMNSKMLEQQRAIVSNFSVMFNSLVSRPVNIQYQTPHTPHNIPFSSFAMMTPSRQTRPHAPQTPASTLSNPASTSQ